jgi:plastocyanin
VKQLIAFGLGALLALAMATCGGDDETNTTTEAQPAGAAETITVRETEFELDPANPRIEQAGPVEFRVENDGQTVHALEIEGPDGESKTDDIQPGGSATLTANLDKPGSYEWYCPVGNHRDQGMEGTITVGGGGTGTTETGTTETNTTTTGTTETNTTETNTTETEPGEDSGGSGGSGGSGSGGSGSGGSGY